MAPCVQTNQNALGLSPDVLNLSSCACTQVLIRMLDDNLGVPLVAVLVGSVAQVRLPQTLNPKP